MRMQIHLKFVCVYCIYTYRHIHVYSYAKKVCAIYVEVHIWQYDTFLTNQETPETDMKIPSLPVWVVYIIMCIYIYKMIYDNIQIYIYYTVICIYIVHI